MSAFVCMFYQQENVMYIPKHKRLLKQCGVRIAALYLKNRGYTAEQAVTLLLR